MPSVAAKSKTKKSTASQIKDLPELLTKTQIATFLSIHLNTVQLLLEKGVFNDAMNRHHRKWKKDIVTLCYEKYEREKAIRNMNKNSTQVLHNLSGALASEVDDVTSLNILKLRRSVEKIEQEIQKLVIANRITRHELIDADLILFFLSDVFAGIELELKSFFNNAKRLSRANAPLRAQEIDALQESLQDKIKEITKLNYKKLYKQAEKFAVDKKGKEKHDEE